MAVSKLDKEVAKKTLRNIVGSLIGDSWILMLCLGALSHRLGIPRLALDYLTCVLIVTIGIAMIPQSFRTDNTLERIMNK